MATISGYDSFSMGMLFSSLNNNHQQNNKFSFMNGGMDMLGINYGDYASIRSGSYHRLLKAYYSDALNDEVKQQVSPVTSTSTSKDDVKTLTKIENAVKDLKDSAAALQANGKGSLYEKVEKTDKDGITTEDYDRDAIFKAVDKFVKDYNSVLESAGDSNTVNILRSAKTMVNYTKVNERLLAKAGITIGEDNKLSLDKEKLDKANVTDLQALFAGRNSYAGQTQMQASMMDIYAKNEAAKANTYGRNGVYTYNYNTGELYNSRI